MKAIVFLYFMLFQSLHIQKLSQVYEKWHGIDVDGARDFLMIVDYFTQVTIFFQFFFSHL